MNRTGLLAALSIAVVAGLVFGLFPALDLKLERPFFDAARGGFWLRVDPTLMLLRDLSRWLITLIAVVPGFALIAKLIMPRRPLIVPGRAIVFLLSTLALGPGLVTNIILKDHWHRPRPIDVVQFGEGIDPPPGDNLPFVPWWNPHGLCGDNCSFVAGEPSGAFWTLAPAALMPPQWRPLAYGAAIVFGVGISLVRMAGGGHFFADVVFAGVFTFMVVWLIYGLLYRWRATRITDAAVEGLLERIAMPGYLLVRRMVARRGAATRHDGKP